MIRERSLSPGPETKAYRCCTDNEEDNNYNINHNNK